MFKKKRKEYSNIMLPVSVIVAQKSNFYKVTETGSKQRERERKREGEKMVWGRITLLSHEA